MADDLTALLERGLRDYKAIDSTDPSGVSHLGLDDADYLALAARLAEVCRGYAESHDYEDMRKFQEKFIRADHELREAVALLRDLVAKSRRRGSAGFTSTRSPIDTSILEELR